MTDRIRVALFDIGGVLVTDAPAPADVARALGAKRTLEEVSAAVWAHRDDYDLGLDDRAYWQRVGADLGIDEIGEGMLAKLLDADRGRWSTLDADTVAFADELAESGQAIGVLSNAPRSFAQAFREAAWPREKMRYFLFSSELGVAKPAPAIYEAATRATGVPAAQIAFFDDRPGNVEGARAAGLTAFVWNGADRARADLAGL